MHGNSQTNIVTVVVGIFCVAVIAITFAAENPLRLNSENLGVAQLRKIHVAMVIFGNGNNDCLPGLNNKVEVLKASEKTTGSTTQTGAAPSARLWLLLDTKHLDADTVMSPAASADAKDANGKPRYMKWENGPVTTANHTIAMSQIAESPKSVNTKNDLGRTHEWKNNANEFAVMLCDYNTGRNGADANISSLWTNQASDWKGGIVWGDNHAQFAQTSRGFTTRYLAVKNTSDNLFASKAAAGVTEPSEKSDSNAMMTYEDEAPPAVR